MEARIDIDEKFLATCATGTLTGVLMTENPGFGMVGDKATLVFYTSSLSYCERKGGPRSIIMLDYVPICLVQDVLRLMEMGIAISVEDVRQD